MSLAVFALVASPLLAFLGVLLGHRVTRRGAVELDRWRKREETMRLLRWAAELAVAVEAAPADVGYSGSCWSPRSSTPRTGRWWSLS